MHSSARMSALCSLPSHLTPLISPHPLTRDASTQNTSKLVVYTSGFWPRLPTQRARATAAAPNPQRQLVRPAPAGPEHPGPNPERAPEAVRVLRHLAAPPKPLIC